MLGLIMLCINLNYHAIPEYSESSNVMQNSHLANHHSTLFISFFSISDQFSTTYCIIHGFLLWLCVKPTHYMHRVSAAQLQNIMHFAEQQNNAECSDIQAEYSDN